jgi:hypothetical protein
MDMACSMHGRYAKFERNKIGSLNKKDNFEDAGVDRRKILK